MNVYCQKIMDRTKDIRTELNFLCFVANPLRDNIKNSDESRSTNNKMLEKKCRVQKKFFSVTTFRNNRKFLLKFKINNTGNIHH